MPVVGVDQGRVIFLSVTKYLRSKDPWKRGSSSTTEDMFDGVVPSCP